MGDRTASKGDEISLSEQSAGAFSNDEIHCLCRPGREGFPERPGRS